MREHYSNLTLSTFTRRMKIELAKHVVMLLNAFSPKSGMSKTSIPQKIMTGKALDWKKICKIHFEAYAQM